MAFTDADDARDEAKVLLDIPSAETAWNTMLSASATRVIGKLSPIMLKETTPDTSKTLTAETNTIALPAGTVEVRWLELKETNGVYLRYTGWYQHDNDLYFDRTWNIDQTVKIFGLAEYAIDDIPSWCDIVILNWMMSEFFALMASNKRKYNHYIETSGARAVDNLRDLSDYWLDRGNQELMDRVKLRGQ